MNNNGSDQNCVKISLQGEIIFMEMVRGSSRRKEYSIRSYFPFGPFSLNGNIYFFPLSRRRWKNEFRVFVDIRTRCFIFEVTAEIELETSRNEKLMKSYNFLSEMLMIKVGKNFCNSSSNSRTNLTSWIKYREKRSSFFPRRKLTYSGSKDVELVVVNFCNLWSQTFLEKYIT